jgi:hypothetical protein
MIIEPTELDKGRFQVSEDHDSPDHKALLRFLNEHPRSCCVSGEYFYWVYRNGSAIGRKLAERNPRD